MCEFFSARTQTSFDQKQVLDHPTPIANYSRLLEIERGNRVLGCVNYIIHVGFRSGVCGVQRRDRDPWL